MIFAIVGGAFMPRLQGAMIDGEGMTIAGQMLESVRYSFFLPLGCFVVIAVFGFAVALFPPKWQQRVEARKRFISQNHVYW